MSYQAIEEKYLERILNEEQGLVQDIYNLSSDELKEVYSFLNLLNVLKVQNIPTGKESKFIKTMLDVYEDEDKAMLAINLYNFGRIQGIREERAKRKGACK